MVELGAGIGRFTRPLAEQAKSMVALDFMPNLIAENKAQNGHLGNIDFRCGLACSLGVAPRTRGALGWEEEAERKGQAAAV